MNSWHVVTQPIKPPEQGGFVDRTVLWDDELYLGPVPDAVDFRTLLHLREVFWKELNGRRTPQPRAADVAALQARSRRPWLRVGAAYDSLCEADELIIWRGIDLTSQLNALQCIAVIPKQTRVALLDIDAIQKGADTINDALIRKQWLQPDERAFAERLWGAFRLPAPQDFQELGATAVSPFEGLTRAVNELRAFFPSGVNGLDGIQARLFGAMQSGSMTVAECVGVALSGTRMGDTWPFALILDELTGDLPLLELVDFKLDIGNTRALSTQKIQLTKAGVSVLQNRADAIHLRGIDRWVGGCHVQSNGGPCLRWDSKLTQFCEI